MAKVRIYSRLYRRLLDIGGYGLVACYAHIKDACSDNASIQPVKRSNGKTSVKYMLLELKTGVSRNTLSKYVPKLIEEGLLSFNRNGGIQLLGTRKVVKKYKKRKDKKIKFVPIKVCTSIVDTKISAKYVIIKSNTDRQNRMIRFKRRLLDMKRDLEDYRTHYFTKKQLYWFNKNKHLIEGVSFYSMLKMSVMSNQRMSNEVYGKASKSTGGYLQRRLNDLGMIISQRHFEDVCGANMSYKEYSSLREHAPNNSSLSYVNNRMCKQKSNFIFDISDVEKGYSIRKDMLCIMTYLVNGKKVIRYAPPIIVAS